MEKCWAKEYCKQYGQEICNEDCIAYHQLKFLYDTSNMPEKYKGLLHLDLHSKDKEQQKFLENFRDNIKEKVDNGEGVILASKNKGNGKTSWACILMNQYFKEIALENNMKVRGKFVSVPDFLQGLRDDFDRDAKRMEITKKHIRNADIVIWDDIGAESQSEWVRETLYNFINYRISNNLTQIYTSNKTKIELENDLKDRIMSRILGQCTGLGLRGPDQRGS